MCRIAYVLRHRLPSVIVPGPLYLRRGVGHEGWEHVSEGWMADAWATYAEAAEVLGRMPAGVLRNHRVVPYGVPCDDAGCDVRRSMVSMV